MAHFTLIDLSERRILCRDIGTGASVISLLQYHIAGGVYIAQLSGPGILTQIFR